MFKSSRKLKVGATYEVIGGSFKGSFGLLEAGFSNAGILWLTTGLNCRILVTKAQIKLEG